MSNEIRSTLAQAHTVLQHLPTEDALLGSLVLEGLRQLMEADYDTPPAVDPRLRKHFLSDLARLPYDDHSHWFLLFEDLALVFRERALLHPESTPSRIGLRIQEYFETCGEWYPDDGTLVSRLYWEEFPQRHGF